MYLKILLLSSLMIANIFAMQPKQSDRRLLVFKEAESNLINLPINMHSSESLESVSDSCKDLEFWIKKLKEKETQNYNVEIKNNFLAWRDKSPTYRATIDGALIYYKSLLKNLGSRMIDLHIAIRDVSVKKAQEQSSIAVTNYALLSGIKEKIQEIDALIPEDIE